MDYLGRDRLLYDSMKNNLLYDYLLWISNHQLYSNIQDLSYTQIQKPSPLLEKLRYTQSVPSSTGFTASAKTSNSQILPDEIRN